MNYKVVQKKHKWAVVENRSTLEIEYCITKSDAQKVARRLNAGRGFDGWSPTFIATKEKL